MHKHYVVVYDWAVDHICDSGVQVLAVCHNLDEAKAIFAENVVDEKQYATEHGWEIYADTDTEFDAGEDGYYASEHAHYYIQEVN